MLLVVLFHAGTGVAYFGDFYPRGIDVFNQVVEPYRMPALMFLSGMLLHRSLSKSASLYFGGKARKIAWPYVLWSLIGLMLAGDVIFAGALVRAAPIGGGGVAATPLYLDYCCRFGCSLVIVQRGRV